MILLVPFHSACQWTEWTVTVGHHTDSDYQPGIATRDACLQGCAANTQCTGCNWDKAASTCWFDYVTKTLYPHGHVDYFTLNSRCVQSGSVVIYSLKTFESEG